MMLSKIRILVQIRTSNEDILASKIITAIGCETIILPFLPKENSEFRLCDYSNKRILDVLASLYRKNLETVLKLVHSDDLVRDYILIAVDDFKRQKRIKKIRKYGE